MAENKIRLPGQNALTALLLLNEDEDVVLDLLPMCDMFTLIESIDSNSISAVCKISDLSDIINRFPLTGDEIVVASWKTETNTSKETINRECVLRIVDINNIGHSVESAGIGIEISLISEYAYKQAFHNVDEAFSTNIKDAVEKVHAKALSNRLENAFEAEDFKIYRPEFNAVIADDTVGVFDFIIPSETPFKAMEYLVGWASNPSATKSDIWFYYQTLDGFKFTNFEALFAAPFNAETHTYHLRGSFNPTDINALYTISSMRQLSRSNLFNLGSTGRLRSQVKELSYTHKRVETTEYNFLDEDYNMEGKELIMSEKFKKTLALVPTETHWVYRDSTTTDFTVNDFLPHKWSMQRIVRNNTVQIKVPGNADLAAGHILDINIKRPFSIGKNNEKPLDKTLSGKYIIKDLIHMFTPSTYTQEVTLIRPGAVDASKVEE